MALAEWVAKGAAALSTSGPSTSAASASRTASTDWVRTRTLEAYAKHYTIAWPSEEDDVRPPHPPLAALRPSQGRRGLLWRKTRLGTPELVRRPRAGEDPVDRYSYQRPGWFDAVGREHQAAREGGVLIDQTSFAKFTLKGPDAAKALNWIAAGQHRPRGGQPDLYPDAERQGRHRMRPDRRAPRARDEFYIVTGTGFATHDFDWISRNLARRRASLSTSPRALPCCR